MNRETRTIGVVAAFFALAFFSAKFVVTGNIQMVFLPFVAFALITAGLRMPVQYLLVLLLYILIAGSASDYRVRAQVFYLRFALLSLLAVRFFPQLRDLPENVYNTLKTELGSRFHWFLIVFCAFSVISSLYSIDKGVTIQRSLAFSILIFAAFWFFYSYSYSHERVKNLLFMLVQATMWFLCLGFLFLLAGYQGAQQSTGRLRLFLFAPNQLGYLCGIVFPALYWFYSEATEKRLKYWLGFGVALFAFTIIMTASRGAILVLLTSGFVLIGVAYPKRLVGYALIGLTIGSLAFIFESKRAGELVSNVETSLVRKESLSSGSGRIPIWEQAMALVKHKRLLGYGFGTNYALFDQGYFPLLEEGFHGKTVHNSFIEVLLDVGYLGATFFFSFFVILFIWVANRFRSLLQEDKKLVATIGCCVLSGLSSAFFESWLTSPGSVFSFPFWMCCALLIKTVILSEKKAQQNQSEKAESDVAA